MTSLLPIVGESMQHQSQDCGQPMLAGGGWGICISGAAKCGGGVWTSSTGTTSLGGRKRKLSIKAYPVRQARAYGSFCGSYGREALEV